MDTSIQGFAFGFVHTQAAGTVPLFSVLPNMIAKNWDSLRRGSRLTTTLVVFACARGSPIFCSGGVSFLGLRATFALVFMKNFINKNKK